MTGVRCPVSIKLNNTHMGKQTCEEQSAIHCMSSAQYQSMQETQESMLLLVYNPHSAKSYHHVCIPANSLHYSIRDYNDEEVEYQLVPLPAAVINLPGRSSSAIQQLCFEAESVPPLGYTAFFVSSTQDRLAENEYAKKFKNKQEPEQEISPTIHNEFIKVTVNKDTGFLESISHVDGVKIDLSQNFYYYSQSPQSHQSGAYSFRPDKNRPTPVAQRVSYHTIKGPLIKEIRQRFADWVTQTIRLYRGEEFVEFEWVIGPIPIGSDLGKEVVSIFSTNVTNSGSLYTDSNGRQGARRTCWNESTSQQQKKPVASCYYPVTSHICIQSQNTSVAMCVLTDRTQGGTSYNEGEIELMVHRRLLTDDGFGLEEPLNEEAYGVGLVVKGKHRVMLGNFKQDVDELSWEGRVSALSRRWRLQPWLAITNADKISRRRWQNVRNKRYSLLRARGLPRHVHILTLEPWKGGAVLLRLENTLEKARGPYKPDKMEASEDLLTKNSHVTVHLRQIFVQYKIRAVRETTLAANQWLDDARQMDWSTRYVYNGADDDILAEDNAEYRDEAKVTKEAESKDAGPYSEEEEYARKKAPKKPKEQHKTGQTVKRYTDDRKKRSINQIVPPTMENINENIINASFNKLEHEEKANVSTESYKSTVSTLLYATNVTDEITRLMIAKERNTVNVVTRATPRKMNGIPNNVWSKPAKFFANLQVDNTTSEEIASDEDFSSNLRKRSSRRRNKTVKKNKEAAPQILSNSDDGITRSIFDMYYRPFTQLRTLTSSIEYEGVPKKRSRNKIRRFKNDDYGERSTEDRRARYQDQTQPKNEQPADEGRLAVSQTRRRNERRGRERVRDRVKTGEIVYEDSQSGEGRGRQRYHEKSIGADMPFFITDERKYRTRKRAYADSGEYDEMDTVPERHPMDELPRDELPSDEGDDDQEPADEDRIRHKRAAREDPPITDGGSQEPDQTDQSEPEYIITLRPTQIRTFVIWFEPSKSPYVM